jgi:amino acid permease
MNLLIEKLMTDYMSLFIKATAIYMIIIFMVSIACIIDYKSGIRKAKERGEKLLSHGFRKSILKTIQYYAFLLFGLMFDFFILIILHGWDVNEKMILPYVSLLFGFIIIRIEYKSVKEKASDKIRSKIPDIDLVEIFKQPDIKSRLRAAIEQIDKKEKEDGKD